MATDAPIRKPAAKQLASGGPAAPQKEKRWISSGKHFATEVGKSDDIALLDACAKEAADAYC